MSVEHMSLFGEKRSHHDLLKEMTDRLGGVIIIHLSWRVTVEQARCHIESKGVLVYDAYDYHGNTDVGTEHIQLMDAISQYRCNDMAPQIYVVDEIKQLYDNSLWNRLLDVRGCLVMDAEFNIVEGRSTFAQTRDSV